VFCSESGSGVVTIPYTLKLLLHTFHIWNIYRAQRLFLRFWTAALGVNDRVNETLGIAVQLKVMSEVVDLLGQILSVLAYGGRSVVETLNQSSFHMGRVLRFEYEIPTSMSGIFVYLCDQCCLFSDHHNIQKGNRIVRLSFHSEADGRP
jgi:hypothetical protein